MNFRTLIICLILTACMTVASLAAGPDVASFAKSFQTQIKPLLADYCNDCHDDDKPKADIDLTLFDTFDAVRKQPKIWIQVDHMIRNGEMPPRKSDQPTDAERQKIVAWIRGYLTAEAEAHAGDPGRVVLRRLSNAEYTYSLRDLTGLSSLDPAREFPIDGAAGEGFTNSGDALGMSPALVDKYLDAGKKVAQHLVLLPDGIRFSTKTSRRDQTDEAVERIQHFYRTYSDQRGSSAVNLQGVQFQTNQGGRLPLKQYLEVLIAERDALADREKTIDQISRERSLSPKYLGMLWGMLKEKTPKPSTLLDMTRAAWQASPPKADALVNDIERWQQRLWKFNTIGDIGHADDRKNRKTWLEAVNPLGAQHDVRLKLPKSDSGQDVVLYLTAHDAGDGHDRDFAVWHNPRLEYKGKPPVSLRDLYATAQRVENLRSTELKRTAVYLSALAATSGSSLSIEAAAQQFKVDAALLSRWSQVLDLAQRDKPTVSGHFTQKIVKAQGFDAIGGWGTGETPNLLANRSDQPISFLTLTVPARAVAIHPSPTHDAVIAWQSPIQGRIRIEGHVADADRQCGNGAAWHLEHQSVSGSARLAEGVIDNGGRQIFKPEAVIEVQPGDVIHFVINARDRNHSCDTTDVGLKITDAQKPDRIWDLAADNVDQITESNPRPDRFGNAGVWHFCSITSQPASKPAFNSETILARWRHAILSDPAHASVATLANDTQHMLTRKDPDALQAADQALRHQLLDWNGPLQWQALSQNSTVENDTSTTSAYGLDPALFGKHPDGSAIDADSVCVKAPHVLEVRLPAAALTDDAEFVTTGSLHAGAGDRGSVQFMASTTKTSFTGLVSDAPVAVADQGIARKRFEQAFDDFRNLFPAALCYVDVVPVDAVVTLTLFYREDDQLRRLMLSDEQSASLNRMWDELRFISQEPLQLATAYEQVLEFQTQGTNKSVKAEKPKDSPIMKWADAFRQQLIQAEPAQLQAVMDFAGKAWRRAPTPKELQRLRDLYRDLRKAELSHENAIQLTLARVLTAPAFLYKLESPAPGPKAAPVTGTELASRLSYFLWSSTPDQTLRTLGDSNQLLQDQVLLDQAHRMLQDPKIRRMAIHFACQWLHIRNFDQNDEKNEKLYPEFKSLRGAMYEESVRFFEDMFRHDGSILSLLNADHTFMDGSLAEHYGIDGLKGDAWQRVENMQSRGRGGVLAMATVLAVNSGASRTSPILRGNWVYETLLGERLPRPPANVPQLPDEAPRDGLTARQLIEQHSSNVACARCHKRIDPYGFSLEQYDAIGRLRPQVVDTKTQLMNGRNIEGLDGLRAYLLEERLEDVVHQFCKKLLGYALGREVQLSDQPLLSDMKRQLQSNDYRFSVAIDAIITSPQFRQIRGAQHRDD